MRAHLLPAYFSRRGVQMPSDEAVERVWRNRTTRSLCRSNPALFLASIPFIWVAAFKEGEPGLFVFTACWTCFAVWSSSESLVDWAWELSLAGDRLYWRSWLRTGVIDLEDIVAIERRSMSGGLAVIHATGDRSLSLFATGARWEAFVRELVRRAPDVERRLTYGLANGVGEEPPGWSSLPT